MRQVIKRPPGKIRPAPEPHSTTIRIQRVWSGLKEGIVGPYHRRSLHRAARPNVDKAKRWRSRHSWWILPIAIIGAVAWLGWGLWGAYVVLLRHNASPVETYCSNVGACGVAYGFVAPLLAAAVATVLFFIWPRSRVKRPIVRKAKSRPRDLVPTAGTIMGRVVGREELCRVIMKGLRDQDSRRPYLLVGGVGTGKTAVIVELTRMLAERKAVPVPIRLRDVENELNFDEVARERFCEEVDPGSLPVASGIRCKRDGRGSGSW